MCVCGGGGVLPVSQCGPQVNILLGWFISVELPSFPVRLRPDGRYLRVESIWEDLECFLVYPIVVNYNNILYCGPLYHVF